jgi:hypothetical protein
MKSLCEISNLSMHINAIVLSVCLYVSVQVSFTLADIETVLLAMADCQAKTDESAEIIILGCTAETRQPQSFEAI